MGVRDDHGSRFDPPFECRREKRERKAHRGEARHGVIGPFHFRLRRVLVGIGIDGGCHNPHSPCRCNHLARDPAAVRDEDFSENLGPLMGRHLSREPRTFRRPSMQASTSIAQNTAAEAGGQRRNIYKIGPSHRNPPARSKPCVRALPDAWFSPAVYGKRACAKASTSRKSACGDPAFSVRSGRPPGPDALHRTGKLHSESR